MFRRSSGRFFGGGAGVASGSWVSVCRPMLPLRLHPRNVSNVAVGHRAAHRSNFPIWELDLRGRAGVLCSQITNKKTMKLLGRNRLRALYGLDEQTDAWVRNWVSELSHANWKVAKDVLRQYPRARNVANDVFQFPVGQHLQYIEVAMVFSQAVALVVDLKSTN